MLKMQYKQWLIKWLDGYVLPTSKIKTYNRYKEIIERHIIPKLGELDLNELKPYPLQRFFTELSRSGNIRTGEGLSASSINSIITVTQGALKVAYSVGLVDEYIGDRIKRPKTDEKRIECFSFTEQKQIEEYLKSSKQKNGHGILLTLYTGLRIGELLALEWSDIDIKKCEAVICKTCHYGIDENGFFGRITNAPKTKSSIRTIPIPRQLMPILREAKKCSSSKYVISNGESPVSMRSYQRSFALLLKKLNLKHRGFHSLRHTFATRALECGIDVKTLSEFLGHKSPTITLNRYAHSMAEHKKEMMNKLGKLL